MKKNDIILIGIIIIIAAVSLLFINATKKSGDTVIITVDKKVYKELPLDQDTTVEIPGANGGRNVLVIKDGYADVIEASCPDEICVDQRKIQNNGETIVCLPNKVIIKVKSDNKNEVDSIAN